MHVFLFAQHYPIPYKPYYDTQFADLIQQGHEVSIFAAGRGDRVLNEKVIRYGLDRRTRYVPTTLRTLPQHLPAVTRTIVSGPRQTLRPIRRVAAGSATWKSKLLNTMRMLSMGKGVPDLCLIHGLGTAQLFDWLGEVFSGLPIALYYHGGEVPQVRRWSDESTRRAFDAAHIVFTNTKFSLQNAVSRGCPPEKIEVLPVGFALDEFRPPSPRRYRRDGILRLLSAGRMSEEKGFIHALEAVRRLVESGFRSLTYSLTGEGYLRPRLESYVRENGLERYVRFLGTLSTAGVLEAMKEADVLLLPSIQVGDWVENQACAVQEAMLLETLVVTTQTGGVPESIPQAMRAFCVPPGNPEALADALASIHRMEPGELQALGKAGRAFVQEHYDIRKLNARMIKRAIATATRRLTPAQPV